MYKVAVFIGSIRSGSINRAFAEAIEKLAAGRLSFTYVDIASLPLYNEDLWADAPGSVKRLKAEIEAADAVLMVTPEYNRTYTPAILNAVNWGTRPWGQNSWAGKPAAITGTTPGAIGTAVAQNMLKQLMVVSGTVLMGQPELYFTYKPENFDAEGNLTDAAQRQFVSDWIDRFVAWIEMVSGNRARSEAAE